MRLEGKREMHHISEIFWPLERNKGRAVVDSLPPSPAEERQLVESLSNGWMSHKTTPIHISVPPKAKLSEYQKRRENQWAALKKAAAEGGEDELRMLEAFEHYYVSGGKLLPIKYVANFGFQRSQRFEKAYVRAVYPPVVGGKPVEPPRPAPDFTLETLVVDYVSDDALVDIQIDENVMSGKTNIGVWSFLPVARTMFAAGKLESDFTRKFNQTTGKQMRWLGQLLHRLMRLAIDPRYRDLKLQSRIDAALAELSKKWQEHYSLPVKEQAKDKGWKTLTYRPGGPIDVSKLDKEMIAAFLKKPEEVSEVSLFRKRGYTHTPEGLETYIEHAMSGQRAHRQNAMTAKSVQQWRDTMLSEEGSKNELAAFIANAVLQNDTSNLVTISTNKMFGELCTMVFRIREDNEAIAKAIAALQALSEEKVPSVRGRKRK